MFIPIQQQQGTFADGYTTPPLRTGYEQVIGQRTVSIFASTAQADGKVVKVTGRALTVEYEDGTREHIELGTRPGRASNVIYPQRLTTRLKEGDTVKKGDNLAYNSNYFQPDPYNPGQVSLKMGVMAKTAIVDTIDTFEDSCAISGEMATKLNTQLMEMRVIEARFDQHVKNLVKVGDRVDVETMLCTIEDPETADHGEFDEMALDTIRRLTAMSPRAKVQGVVSRIEWFYHGDLEDIGGNLREQVEAAEQERRRQARALGQKYMSGQVDTSFRLRGRALDPDTVAIRVYIDINIGTGLGDKLVFGNQMKSIISRVMTGENRTEDGTPIDALFGNTSIEDRRVHSPRLIGTTNTLLRVLSKHVAAVYRGTTPPKAKRQPR